ncbi:hypothetical protein L1987_03679 [Smallanthus sonchifolius]|uniref:Uncharacterized protein n=1 Tax=Smallanthus sonchifolius TaxID=185202 RepID=A0ACB9KBF7_9ASTR|nr:hypothetical protein L1987_03679 [Smallanthus sonchifolius]
MCTPKFCPNFQIIFLHRSTPVVSTVAAGASSKARVGSSQPSETSFKRKRGVFQKDFQHMMYGFGDDPNSLPETVALVEDIVVEYVTDMGSVPGSKHFDFKVLVLSRVGPVPEGSDPLVTPSENRITSTCCNKLSMEVYVHKAQDIASKRGKLLTEDFLFLIQKDLPKLNRCTELLSKNEELKQARKAFDVDEEKLASAE